MNRCWSHKRHMILTFCVLCERGLCPHDDRRCNASACNNISLQRARQTLQYVPQIFIHLQVKRSISKAAFTEFILRYFSCRRQRSLCVFVCVCQPDWQTVGYSVIFGAMEENRICIHTTPDDSVDQTLEKSSSFWLAAKESFIWVHSVHVLYMHVMAKNVMCKVK